jgi:hypothetical protein
MVDFPANHVWSREGKCIHDVRWVFGLKSNMFECSSHAWSVVMVYLRPSQPRAAHEAGAADAAIAAIAPPKQNIDE